MTRHAHREKTKLKHRGKNVDRENKITTLSDRNAEMESRNRKENKKMRKVKSTTSQKGYVGEQGMYMKEKKIRNKKHKADRGCEAKGEKNSAEKKKEVREGERKQRKRIFGSSLARERLSRKKKRKAQVHTQLRLSLSINCVLSLLLAFCQVARRLSHEPRQR